MTNHGPLSGDSGAVPHNSGVSYAGKSHHRLFPAQGVRSRHRPVQPDRHRHPQPVTHAKWAFEYLQTQYGLHNRIAVNDPDFLLVRGLDTSTETETNVLNPKRSTIRQSRSDYISVAPGTGVFSSPRPRAGSAAVLLMAASFSL